MWLKSYAHSRDIRETGLQHADVDGHVDELRYWKIHQPIVTQLLRCATVKVACPPGRSTYEHGPAVIAGWVCMSPGMVHWVGVKRSIMRIGANTSEEGEAARDLVRDLIGPELATPRRLSFDLMDMRAIRAIPEHWRRHRGWLQSLREVVVKRLDGDQFFSTIVDSLMETAEWESQEERAA